MRHFKDWLENYADFASRTEAPRHVHYWAGVTLAASVMGHRVWFQRPFGRWYPSLYTLAVGPTDVINGPSVLAPVSQMALSLGDLHVSRTTARADHISRAFIASALSEETSPGVYETHMNVLGLYEQMREVFVPNSALSYHAMRHVWDGDDMQSLAGSRGPKLQNTTFSWLGCSTPMALRMGASGEPIETGLIKRIIMVYSGPHQALRWVMSDPAEHRETEQKLLDDLEAIRSLRGPAIVKPRTQELIDQAQADAAERSASRVTRYGRPRDYVALACKIGMVLAAAQGNVKNGQVILSPHIFEAAMKHVEFLEEQRKECLRFIGDGKRGLVLSTMMDVLETRGEVPAAELAHACLAAKVRGRDFAMYIVEAMERGELAGRKGPDGRVLISLPPLPVRAAPY